MDHIDVKILNILQNNARAPLKVIADQVYLSSPAVAARINRLEHGGIIKGYHTSINWLKLGFHITAFINLEVEPNQKSEFYPFIKSCPNVIECNCVTGQYAMLLKVCFPSTMELDTFIGQIQRFGRTSTQIVFSTAVEHRGVQKYDIEDPALNPTP
jgi:Lrp/AsnC family transcriptional regulator, leucine-responsive regulatory protein